MQDRYAGDIGDFAKYGLLRALCGDDLRLGVLWYLVPDEPSDGNGGVTGYLDSVEAGLRECDPDLFDELRGLVATERSVAEVQRRRILPERTSFFEHEAPAGLRERRRWVQDGVRAVADADLVFADPDNSLRDPSARTGRTEHKKHAYYDEIQPCWRRGQSLMIYQHTARLGTFEEQIASRVRDLCTHFDGAPGLMILRWRRVVSRAFLIIPAAAHADRLTARVDALLDSPWGQRQQGYATPHFELVAYE
ncbi:MAG: hypothetical protein F4X76_03105 [Chloroflexi bacterium]|nr:hypothetical protein [Chloroflexota bacterium]